MPRPRSVVIVGGGPAGLVAAKTLLHAFPRGTFEVTLLEKSKSVGGLWPVADDQQDGMLNPSMPTNLSRYNVCFSDLAWETTDLETVSSSIPMFPRAWQVGRYLQCYAQKYIPEGVIRLESMVTSAVREKYKDRYRWKVDWTAPPTREDDTMRERPVDDISKMLQNMRFCQGFFDHLIVASGFFSAPKGPESNEFETFPGPVLHSSELRSLEGFLGSSGHPTDSRSEGGSSKEQNLKAKLLVVGGSMSGAEAAASLAFDLSSARYSPQASSLDYEVVHVTSRPFYPLPTMIPRSLKRSQESSGDEHPPTFVPIDLGMYDLSRRPQGPISDMSGKMSPSRAKPTHAFLQSIIGGDQSGLRKDTLLFTPEREELPAYVAINDRYAEFVRSGDIRPIAGRATEFGLDSNGKGAVTVSDEGKNATIENVAGIILATGFQPQQAISWLSEEVKQVLDCDDACHRMPLILQKRCICHEKIPDLGFVGFYEGPYWGVMEMQARLIARRWGDDVGKSLIPGPPEHDGESQELKEMQALRQAIRGSDMIPQFWMGDYVGLMEGFARELEKQRAPLAGYGDRDGPVIGARYTPADNSGDIKETQKILTSLETILAASTTHATFVPRATFRALQGSWNIFRDLNSKLATFPSGIFTGTAAFHPRLPTNSEFDAEYLYSEQGELVTQQGYTMKASRSYVYRYREVDDQLSVWFVKPDDGKSVDYFFHELQFIVPSTDAGALQENNAGGGGSSPDEWKACGYHLCVDDEYRPDYTFKFRGVTLSELTIAFHVTGPKKDYLSSTRFTRA